MKKAFIFLKGSMIALITLLAIALLILIGLLISGTELYIDNLLVSIYSYPGNANVHIKDIPTLIAFVAGGIVSLNKYNQKESVNDEE